MLKIYQVFPSGNHEIFPVNNIYNVIELGKYMVVYNHEIISTQNVFLEDELIDISKLDISKDQITLSSSRYFENYFGYASLNINNEIFFFNIKIEKLKLSEIEDIFIYLWKREDKLFNIFFSRSTYELDFKKKGLEIGNTSKLISYVETFLSTFDKLYYVFASSSHTVLRKKEKKTPFQPDKVTPDTVHWLLHNLDEIHFDNLYKGHNNSIKINNQYGLIDSIYTVENFNSPNNYENQVILGGFEILLKKLKNLKTEINSRINLRSDNNEIYADFKDLKRIPFIKLFEDSLSLEKKTIKLYKKYKILFGDILPITDKPILTSVFSQKLHYKKAFTLIKNLRDYKFDLKGEFKLLNISKLSKLYEVYNLYIIIETLQKVIKSELFNISVSSNRNDDIIERLTFKNSDFKITLFYEHKFFTNAKLVQETSLRRINSWGSYYSPDYIIEIINLTNAQTRYYILDAKYSKEQTVNSNHLPDVIKKYVLDTGILNNSNSKINSLSILFPGEKKISIVESSFFEPTINLIGSKPKYEIGLQSSILAFLSKSLFEKYLMKDVLS